MRSLELAADCSRCAGLCCVLVPFRAADGFGVDKDSGRPCHHLDAEDRCSIHATLRQDGWPGCAVFDCFGAGQHVTNGTYGGRSWRDPGVDRGEMAAVLSVMRLLHESLRHLDEVERRAPSDEATALADRVEALADGTPNQLRGLRLEPVLGEVAGVLRAASDRVRAEDRGPRTDLSRADLAGRDLRDTDLRGADLHGALLIRADLRGVDLGTADLLGADVRDADVRGARLAGTLFLTRPQVAAMVGDGDTTLPPGVSRPAHWGQSGTDVSERPSAARGPAPGWGPSAAAPGAG